MFFSLIPLSPFLGFSSKTPRSLTNFLKSSVEYLTAVIKRNEKRNQDILTKNVVLNAFVCFTFVRIINFASQGCLFKGEIDVLFLLFKKQRFLHRTYLVEGVTFPGVTAGVLEEMIK